MKLTQFALAALIVLLVVAGYLTLQNDLDSRLEAQNALNDKMISRMEDLAKNQAAPAPISPSPAPAPVAAPPPPVLAKPPLDPAAAEALAAAAAIPPGAPLASEDDPRMLEDERKVLNLGAPGRVADDTLTLPTTLAGQPLTKIQQRIVAQPAITSVKEYVQKEGMLVLNHGTDRGLKPNDSFALRRNSAVIGRIRLTETIMENEAVADIIPNSMPVGMLPAAGDDIIQFE